MSTAYTITLVVHVVVAVLGLGSVTSIALLAGAARRDGRGPVEVLPWLDPLLRISAVTLGAMLITGALLDFAAKGAFRGSWWFRGSAVLLIAAGALHGRMRRTIRRNSGNKSAGAAVLGKVERSAFVVCVLIVAIAVLMEVKPF